MWGLAKYVYIFSFQRDRERKREYEKSPTQMFGFIIYILSKTYCWAEDIPQK
jgi:hypothetical protein